jgi:hypothetical protein
MLGVLKFLLDPVHLELLPYIAENDSAAPAGCRRVLALLTLEKRRKRRPRNQAPIKSSEIFSNRVG